MNRVRVVAVVAGVGVLAVALVSVLLPGLVAAAAPEPLVPAPEAREAAARAVLPLVGVGALVAAGYTARQARRSEGLAPIVSVAVEAGDSDAVDTVGRRFRHTRAWAASQWHHPGTTAKAGELESRLRSAALRCYAYETGVDDETARQAIDTGVWTDDDLAAWFVAGAEGRPPGTWWLRERLRPGPTYREYVNRSATAIDDLRGGGS